MKIISTYPAKIKESSGAFEATAVLYRQAVDYFIGIMLWAVGLGGGYWLGFSAESVGGPFGAEGFWGATAFGLALAGITLATMVTFVAKTRTKEFLAHHQA